jgi:hypothetical protein
LDTLTEGVDVLLCRARFGEQQLPNSIGMGRRRDHPDVQHGSSEAKGRSIKVDTSER